MKYFFCILLTYLTTACVYSQADTADTLLQAPAPTANGFRQADTIRSFTDTSIVQLADSTQAPVTPAKTIDSLYLKLLDNPYLQMKERPVYLIINERVRTDKDEMFYLLAGLMMLLAFIKVVFPRYVSNVFRLFFQPSFRQKQTREQLLQNALPSLLLNLFFILSAAAYIALLVDFYNLTELSFWLLYLNSSLLLLILYAGKYVFLTFAGWVFNAKSAAETYMFIVFLINKIIGVLLLPFILLIAFSKPQLTDVAITVSILLISLLFIYRYIVSYAPVRRDVKVSLLHFLIYILAFELTPLLLIYKSLIIYMDKSL